MTTSKPIITAIDIDWSDYFNKLYPYIGSIYLSTTEMKRINESLTKRTEKLVTCLPSTYPTTIYDLLMRIVTPEIGSVREKQMSAGLLKSLNETVRQFIDLVNHDGELVRQLKKQMKDLFQLNESRYLEKLGELYSTVFLIQQHKNFRLVSLEHKYELTDEVKKRDSKDADILFRNEATGGLILIDILNINLDYSKIENAEGLKKTLSKRIAGKIKSKRFDNPDLKRRYESVLIQPFVWIYDLDTIQKYQDVFQKFHGDVHTELLVMRQRSDGQHISYDVCKASEL